MDAPDWEPSLGDIAVHVRARLKSAGGNTLDTFTTATKPSTAQVERLRRLSMQDVMGRIGDLETCTSPIVDELREQAGGLVAVRTAMRIERTHFPNEVRTNGSPYEALKEEWTEGIKALTERVAENCGGGSGDSVGADSTPTAGDTFPDHDIIGYRSDFG